MCGCNLNIGMYLWTSIYIYRYILHPFLAVEKELAGGGHDNELIRPVFRKVSPDIYHDIN